ncbi:hypothetical protein UF64_04125 [Thalassospira sp. HJ]|nr:hypothetical protein UF64_04125 [Thalassospira sp. HJ]
MGQYSEACNNASIATSRQTQLRDKVVKLNAKTQNAPKGALGARCGSGVSVGMGEAPDRGGDVKSAN